jgi:hypothetical protein
MKALLEDRQNIADLMTGRIHRDLAEWDKLGALFHADATIEISWFEGLASDFVEGSRRMAKSDRPFAHATRDADLSAVRRQLFEHSPRKAHVCRLVSLGEPVINRCQDLARFFMQILTCPQAR